MLTRSTFARYETETTKLEEIVDQCTLQLICQIEYYFRNLTIIWQCCFVSWIIWIWAEPKNHWSCWSRSLNQITMQVKSWHIVMCFVRFTLKCPILPPEMADLCIKLSFSSVWTPPKFGDVSLQHDFFFRFLFYNFSLFITDSRIFDKWSLYF